MSSLSGRQVKPSWPAIPITRARVTPLQRGGEFAAQSGQVDIVTVIAGHHRQACQATLGRFGLKHYRQAARPAELERNAMATHGPGTLLDRCSVSHAPPLPPGGGPCRTAA